MPQHYGSKRLQKNSSTAKKKSPTAKNRKLRRSRRDMADPDPSVFPNIGTPVSRPKRREFESRPYHWRFLEDTQNPPASVFPNIGTPATPRTPRKRKNTSRARPMAGPWR
jgi:hypothetical protein